MVCHYVKITHDAMFVFVDKKAMITYYAPWRTLVYLHGDFVGDNTECVHEMHRAAVSTLN